MHAVGYRVCGISEIGLIRPLWEQLNTWHQGNATTFRDRYERMTFEDRNRYFEKLHHDGLLRLDLALDTMTGRYVGYCVSSLSPEKNGELESLFVEEAYRSKGIGTVLVQRALGWMESLDAVRKRVSVGNGNEQAWGFYRKFGFYSRLTVLEQKPGPY